LKIIESPQHYRVVGIIVVFLWAYSVFFFSLAHLHLVLAFLGERKENVRERTMLFLDKFASLVFIMKVNGNLG